MFYRRKVRAPFGKTTNAPGADRRFSSDDKGLIALDERFFKKRFANRKGHFVGPNMTGSGRSSTKGIPLPLFLLILPWAARTWVIDNSKTFQSLKDR